MMSHFNIEHNKPKEKIMNVIHNRKSFLIPVVLLLSVLGLASCDKQPDGTESKYKSPKRVRVIHTSDLVGDDENTLIRLLLFSNDQEILGIHSSASPWSGIGIIKKVFRHIDLYEEVYDNLIQHDSAYPTPNYLRSITMAGNEVPNDYRTDSKGSLHIKDVLLDHSNDEPVWVTCWGGPATVTAALRFINDNHPEEKEYVAQKLRIYFVARQGGTNETYLKEKPCLDYINTHYSQTPEMLTCMAYNYMNYWGHSEYWFDNVSYSTLDWAQKNYSQGHGILCSDFNYYNSGDCDGDSPALLHILSGYYGLRSTEDPSYGGWGSRFSKSKNKDNEQVNIDEETLNPHYIADRYAGDTIVRTPYQKMHYSGARWADDFQNELAVRADWCVKNYKETNHPPEIRLLVSEDIEAVQGQIINLQCEGTDPDGDTLSYRWWQYKEAGTSTSSIKLENANTSTASFVCPKSSGSIHIILEVQDNSKEYPLTRYARIIVRMKKEKHN